jgi:hypothetical protein
VKLKKGPWDGAQPRGHVLDVLLKHGVSVTECDDDFYELVDIDGDPEVLYIPNPVLSETVNHIYRRFGALHRFQITDLVKKRTHH